MPLPKPHPKPIVQSPESIVQSPLQQRPEKKLVDRRISRPRPCASSTYATPSLRRNGTARSRASSRTKRKQFHADINAAERRVQDMPKHKQYAAAVEEYLNLVEKWTNGSLGT
jgi:hypothetical protein